MWLRGWMEKWVSVRVGGNKGRTRVDGWWRMGGWLYGYGYVGVQVGGHTDGWMGGRVDGCSGGWMRWCTGECMNGWECTNE